MSLPKMSIRKTAVCPRVLAPLIAVLILLVLSFALPVSAVALRAAGSSGWRVENASAAGSGAGLSSVCFVDAEHG